jgi:pimeloyl-ACP methyl ester carboxylesterase
MKYPRILTSIVLAATAASFGAASLPAFAAAKAQRSTLGGVMNLRDEGSFFVGGKTVTVKTPYYGTTGLSGPGEITVDQMYVNFRIPAKVTGLPVIMVHGSNHTGVTFETTPDGREGWATYFVRHGHPVYIVDHVGRGRSGFNPTPLNEAIAAKDISMVKQASFYARRGAWINFRFGNSYPEPFPNIQFPLEALDHYFSQVVPNAEEMSGGRNGEATITDLTLLLDQIGPAVLLVHSQAGLYGMETVRRSASKIRAFISIEGGCKPAKDGTVDALATIPFLEIWGDNSAGALGANGDQRRNDCRDTVSEVQAAKGNATFYLLPEHGIHGNTHMMMMDRNNLQIADILLGWLKKVK